jgi:UDP-GlcNAc:undecaprenyl-phosphate/decaprenyl-phosphate GlcNAc-1-phosphate transferase
VANRPWLTAAATAALGAAAARLAYTALRRRPPFSTPDETPAAKPADASGPSGFANGPPDSASDPSADASGPSGFANGPSDSASGSSADASGPSGFAGGAAADVSAAPVDRWTRTNHRGEPVTLLEGPAFVAGAAVAAALAPGVPGRVRAAAAMAAGGIGALGAYDDIFGTSSAKGFKGHLTALARGEVTSGAVKILGIGATGLAAAALTSRGPVDTALNGAIIAGCANLANLFDLRPGRAIKVGLLTGVPLVAAAALSSGPHAASAATPSGSDAAAMPSGSGAAATGMAYGSSTMAYGSSTMAYGSSAMAYGFRARQAAVPAAAPLGAAVALLPEDLGERAMLGDAGANALGALLGLAATVKLSRPSRLVLLGTVAALTAASEKISFTKVIAANPVLNRLDMLGRRPAPTAAPAAPTQ